MFWDPLKKQVIEFKQLFFKKSTDTPLNFNITLDFLIVNSPICKQI